MHKVLIVDDERPARNFIAELIVRYLPDSKIYQADNAQKALYCLQTVDVDLMFADIEMPDMTGLQMIEKLQQDRGVLQQPYTFIITAFRKYEYALQGIKLGILDYIEKPLHEEKVFDAVKMYLERKKSDTIEFKMSEGLYRIQINRLLALKTVDRGKIMVYTADIVLPEVAHSLIQIYPLLPPNFQYVRRDCIVNVHEIKHYNLKTKELFIVCQNTEYAFAVSRENMKKIFR